MYYFVYVSYCQVVVGSFLFDLSFIYVSHLPYKNPLPALNFTEKGPENLIITRKHSVYKASGAFKNISSILWGNFAYIPICFATSSAKFSSFFSIPSPVS